MEPGHGFRFDSYTIISLSNALLLQKRIDIICLKASVGGVRVRGVSESFVRRNEAGLFSRRMT